MATLPGLKIDKLTALEKYTVELETSKLMLEDSEDVLDLGERDDVVLAYERVCNMIKRLEKSKDDTTEAMLNEEKTLDEVREWNKKQKEEMKPLREMRKRLKDKMEKLNEVESQQKQQRELEQNKHIMEEQARINQLQQKENEEIKIRQQQREEEWHKRNWNLNWRKLRSALRKNQTKPQAVKLQRYTITPFNGEYKDWLRFWNQFTVEVDGSSISEISKFNYLMELVVGKPKEDILGLPHNEDGYQEAKRTLEMTCGRDIKIHKALIKEFENLSAITSIHKLKEVHEYYNKLLRIIRTLATMKKLDTAQSFVYTLMDKLGPVKEALVQKDDKWEESTTRKWNDDSIKSE